MLEPITIVFGALLVVVLLAAVAMWLNAVSARKNILTENRKSIDLAHPLYLRGTDLFYWARDTAARIVAKYLTGVPTEATPIDLAKDVHAATTCGMFPLGSPNEDVERIPCPKYGQGIIGVTAPEAIEIADYIQKNLPLAERNRIHDLALENASKLANMSLFGFDATQTPCPLLGADGICLAYLARPLRCRPLHAATILGQRGQRRPVDEERDYDEQIVEQGAETGLTEALISAGRDGNVYELNSALVAALDTPNAAERWARGEEIFAQCKRYA